MRGGGRSDLSGLVRAQGTNRPTQTWQNPARANGPCKVGRFLSIYEKCSHPIRLCLTPHVGPTSHIFGVDRVEDQ
jgi:hypothetical protein